MLILPSCRPCNCKTHALKFLFNNVLQQIFIQYPTEALLGVFGIWDIRQNKYRDTGYFRTNYRDMGYSEIELSGEISSQVRKDHEEKSVPCVYEVSEVFCRTPSSIFVCLLRLTSASVKKNDFVLPKKA